MEGRGKATAIVTTYPILRENYPSSGEPVPTGATARGKRSTRKRDRVYGRRANFDFLRRATASLSSRCLRIMAKCIVPSGDLWLHAFTHKTGTYLAMGILAGMGGFSHDAYAVGDLEHANRKEHEGQREYGPFEESCHASENYVGPECARAMNASLVHAMAAVDAHLPSRLRAAITATRAATGLYVKPTLWIRDPVQRTISAYGYHLAGTERWLIAKPNNGVVKKILRGCDYTRRYGVLRQQGLAVELAEWNVETHPLVDSDACAELRDVAKRLGEPIDALLAYSYTEILEVGSGSWLSNSAAPLDCPSHSPRCAASLCTRSHAGGIVACVLFYVWRWTGAQR